jgi:hypothetical protein
MLEVYHSPLQLEMNTYSIALILATGLDRLDHQGVGLASVNLAQRDSPILFQSHGGRACRDPLQVHVNVHRSLSALVQWENLSQQIL